MSTQHSGSSRPEGQASEARDGAEPPHRRPVLPNPFSSLLPPPPPHQQRSVSLSIGSQRQKRTAVRSFPGNPRIRHGRLDWAGGSFAAAQKGETAVSADGLVQIGNRQNRRHGRTQPRQGPQPRTTTRGPRRCGRVGEGGYITSLDVLLAANVLGVGETALGCSWKGPLEEGMTPWHGNGDA